MALECETEFGGLHETPAVNGIVNERANGSETGTGIENGAMTEHANGRERNGDQERDFLRIEVEAQWSVAFPPPAQPRHYGGTA
jgi:hypothetical protein